MADVSKRSSRELVNRVKGTHDILPEEMPAWRTLEDRVDAVMANFGYREIRTPIFEMTDLFMRGVGAETDIVNKEMYTLQDQGKKSLTLRPELTASVVRAYLQNNLGREAPLSRLYYMGPLFRQERPQKGRQRQFHQFGLEAIGSPHPEQDVEVIAVAYRLCQSIAGDGLSVKINTIGSPSTRAGYLSKLRDALAPFEATLGEHDQQRLKTNPLRLFDTKNPETQALLKEHAPKISDHVSPEDKEHFAAVMAGLDALAIPYEHNAYLVRGLDYYTRTTFEISSSALGAQDALCGGGRYDGLVERLGGKPMPAVGFAAGMERLLMAAAVAGTIPAVAPSTDVYFITLGESAIPRALALGNALREAGFSVQQEMLRRSMKAQLREANRSGAKFAVILGDDELAKEVCFVKNMSTGDQEEVALASLPTHMTTLLSR